MIRAPVLRKRIRPYPRIPIPRPNHRLPRRRPLRPRDQHPPLAGVIFVVDAQGRPKRQLTLPSLQVPNFAFSPDDKTLYVTAVDQIDKSPYRGKLYALRLR